MLKFYLEMKKTFLLTAFLAISGFMTAQSGSASVRGKQDILVGITPDIPVDAYKVVTSDRVVETVVKSRGELAHARQNQGMKFDPSDESFIYVVYRTGDMINYATTLPQILSLFNKYETAPKAILKAMNEGYFPDFEYDQFAGSYRQQGNNLVVDLSKITSAGCPFSKNNYEVAVDTQTGAVSQLRDISQYFTLYGKDCANNPANLEIARQVEAARLKKEEEAKKQKEINAAMQRKIRKIQMKHNR